MLASLALWLVGKGVSQTFAPKLAKGIAILGALGIAAAAFFLWVHFHDRGVVSNAQNKAEAKAAPIIRKADENSADSRARGDEAVRQQQQDIHDAIDPLPDQKLTPRQRARACAILRRQAAQRGTKAPADC
jgi:hypothetical protein